MQQRNGYLVRSRDFRLTLVFVDVRNSIASQQEAQQGDRPDQGAEYCPLSAKSACLDDWPHYRAFSRPHGQQSNCGWNGGATSVGTSMYLVMFHSDAQPHFYDSPHRGLRGTERNSVI
jgi:hypothetical protein